MGSINVTQTTSADTEALWAVVSRFADVSWIPGMADAEIRGEGPGQVRILPGPKGPIEEVLERVDADSKTLVYTIPVNVPFPVTRYHATMVVSDDGGKGRLSWSCDFEPDGVSEEEAGKAIETMYGVMIGWIEDLIAKG